MLHHRPRSVGDRADGAEPVRVQRVHPGGDGAAALGLGDADVRPWIEQDLLRRALSVTPDLHRPHVERDRGPGHRVGLDLLQPRPVGAVDVSGGPAGEADRDRPVLAVIAHDLAVEARGHVAAWEGRLKGTVISFVSWMAK